MWQIADTSLADNSERLDYWGEFLRSTFMPCDVEFPALEGFHCRAEMNRVHDIKVSVGKGRAHRVYREDHNHDNDREVFTVNVNLFGSLGIAQNSRQIQLRRRDFTLLDQDKNYSIIHEGDYKMLTLEIPHRLLADRLRRPESLLAQVISGAKGHGGLAYRFFEQLPHMLDDVDAEEESLLEDSIVTVLANVLNSRDSSNRLTTVGVGHLQRAKDFIAGNLQEPGLSRDDVAENTGLSVRELNRLFAQQGTSITRYLKSQRLVLAAGCLRNPSFKKVTVSEVAYRYGFNDLSHFSNSFRGEFGCSPKQYRHRNMH